jgi:hypothetical protein
MFANRLKAAKPGPTNEKTFLKEKKTHLLVVVYLTSINLAALVAVYKTSGTKESAIADKQTWPMLYYSFVIGGALPSIVISAYFWSNDRFVYAIAARDTYFFQSLWFNLFWPMLAFLVFF